MEKSKLQCAIFWRKAWSKYRSLDRDLINTPTTKEGLKKRKDRKWEKIRLADERYVREMKAFHG